jgi:hypothetical protein
MRQNKEQFKISSLVEEEEPLSIFKEKKLNLTQTGFTRIIHPSLITKTRNFYEKRPSLQSLNIINKFKTSFSEEKQS